MTATAATYITTSPGKRARRFTRSPRGMARVRGMLVQTTDQSILIYDRHTRTRIWLPKSEIADIRPDTHTDLSGHVEACVPAWRPHDKGYPYEV
jgi:hypothetical protein